mmetsp:Transcript_26918/g.38625  ORF Transcript_26918/g.38625 Transcript_26918/m.38625 type:complete len:107 (-) Transcript_26918:65-385(-)|eukprot:CAMPEP_0172424968 /NCGR_PEP_ID=MMETSP1064-20121228/29138_1 /TAXON_ID=202472 /ORGANISM="Aulacoseira subarctica , Strain CCAP 1002/5" /LENGTH=106 /DNA_ID=CAMNT_0013167455 /DNA_START=171 /DNA_END=491 /DNA_ORIENTATION=+
MALSKCCVGDYVNVVCGTYRGQSGYILRFTLWKVEVRLNEGKVVMISQGSVLRSEPPLVEELESVDAGGRAVVVAKMEAELRRVKRSVEALESFMRQLAVGNMSEI